MAAVLLLCMGIHAQDLKSYTRIVKELSSAKYQGRAYARNGVVKAGNYLAGEFAKAGADTVYQQPFKIDINTFPGKMKMMAGDRRLTAGEEFVMREYSPGVHGSYKLYFIDTANFNIDRVIADLNKPEHRGSMVVCDFWFPYRHGDFRKLETAEAGNAGLIFTWDTPLKFYKAYGQRVVEKPVVWTTAAAIKGAGRVTFDIDNKFLKDYESSNIVACVKGRRHDSCFVFTAHYDHLGNIGSKIYCPGVNDNASGTAAIVTLADYYAKHQPEFDIWFVAFAGEETGLNGSTYYSEHPAVPLSRIKYLFNLDMIGDNNPVQYCEVSGQGMEGFAQLERINAEQKLFKGLRRGDLAANSDHYPFAQKGVPCILFEQEEGDYFQYYHTPQDNMEHFCAVTYPLVFKLVTKYIEETTTPVAVDFDERVELMAMVWRLAGDGPFNRNDYPAYCQSADGYFAAYKGHPVVAKAREAMEQEGIGYDAVASYGLHLVISPGGRMDFDKNLSQEGDASFGRWSERLKNDFLPLLEDFYKTSRFHEWYAGTEAMRNEALSAFGSIVRRIDLGWYGKFFGPLPPKSEVSIVLSILCGQNNYGCSAVKKGGGVRITPVISCCVTDGEGHPRFSTNTVLPILIHEFCHPYCNPLDAQHWGEMADNAGRIYELNAEKLKRQAYGSPQTMLDETFVRASVVRYLADHGFAAKKEALLASEVDAGFLLVPDVVRALDFYEQHRGQYRQMIDFMPEYVKAVNAFDAEAARQAMEAAAKNNATYTCNIQDGAADIPSGEYSLVITFSKPIQPSVSLGYGRSTGKFPALSHGKNSVHWDESKTVLTVDLLLEPRTAYSFSIMGEGFRTFDGGTAGETMNIDFRTR